MSTKSGQALPDHSGWQRALVEHETAIRALDGALETVMVERDRLRAENEGLRAALAEIATRAEGSVDPGVDVRGRLLNLGKAARAALASDDNDAPKETP